MTLSPERRFFSTMSVVVTLLIVLGFANTYGHRMISSSETVPAIIHFHAAVFATWLLVFVLQVTLVAKKRVDLHQKIGPWAMCLGGLMVLTGFLVAREAARLGHKGIPGVEFAGVEGFFLLNLTSLFAFTILVALGWIYRNSPQFHKRFMWMAMVAGLAPPGIARLPFVAGNTPLIAITALVLIFSGLVHDVITRRRPHVAYVASLPVVVLSLPPVVTALSSTGLWLGIAHGLIGN